LAKNYKHLFVMDPLEKLNMKLDSSLRLGQALNKFGHSVFITTPQQLNWNSADESALSECQMLNFPESGLDKLMPRATESQYLSHFDAIHMRKDPPYDMEYIATTWVLDSVSNKVRIYNSPAALRDYNEKLLTFDFKDESIPGLLSSCPKQLIHYLKKSGQGDGIIKPLDMFGGKGIQRVNLNSNEFTEESALALFNEETGKGTYRRLLHPFNNSIFEGEIRIFTAFGKLISACLKKPKAGGYMANTSAGATLQSYKPSQSLTQKVEKVSKDLLEKGIFFIGYDIIGEKISEINITSPRLLASPEDCTDYYSDMSNLIHQDLDNFYRSHTDNF